MSEQTDKTKIAVTVYLIIGIISYGSIWKSIINNPDPHNDAAGVILTIPVALGWPLYWSYKYWN